MPLCYSKVSAIHSSLSDRCNHRCAVSSCLPFSVSPYHPKRNETQRIICILHGHCCVFHWLPSKRNIELWCLWSNREIHRSQPSKGTRRTVEKQRSCYCCCKRVVVLLHQTKRTCNCGGAANNASRQNVVQNSETIYIPCFSYFTRAWYYWIRLFVYCCSLAVLLLFASAVLCAPQYTIFIFCWHPCVRVELCVCVKVRTRARSYLSLVSIQTLICEWDMFKDIKYLYELYIRMTLCASYSCRSIWFVCVACTLCSTTYACFHHECKPTSECFRIGRAPEIQKLENERILNRAEWKQLLNKKRRINE